MGRTITSTSAVVATLGIVALALAGCSGAGSPEPKAETTTSVTSGGGAESPGSTEESFADNVLTVSDMTVTITDVKKIAVGEPGNEYGDKPVIAFWYDVTNVSAEDLDATTAWIGTFTAIQDNNPDTVNELDVAGLPDDTFLDSQLESIKIGGTAKNAVAYSLDDETTPVELIASNDFGMTEIGRASFTLD